MHSVDRRRHRTQSSKNFSFETVGSVLKIFQQVRYSNIGEKKPQHDDYDYTVLYFRIIEKKPTSTRTVFIFFFVHCPDHTTQKSIVIHSWERQQ